MFMPKSSNRPGLTAGQNALFKIEEQALFTDFQLMPTIASTFLSFNEKKFLFFLKSVCTDEVFPQVQLIRVVDINLAALEKEWLDAGSIWWEKPGKGEYFMSISMLSLDFVLYDAQQKVKFVIELDGPEHEYDPKVLEESIKLREIEYKSLKGVNKLNEDRARLWVRDRIKEAAVKGANIKFLRVKNGELANLPSLEARLHAEGCDLKKRA